jgi:hypothetical protein
MKNLILLIFCIITLNIYSQEADSEFDGHKWVAPYDLPIPKDWAIERFPIPIGFAPQIPYRGVEDIRFAPGWGNVKSEEYWTYAFLWYLDNSPETDAKIIADNLKAYYTGLVEVNSDSAKISTVTLTQVTTSFNKAPTDKGDLETYTGAIGMTDYMQLKPITLNCIVHLKSCPDSGKTLLFYELSPTPFTHKNWQSLNQLWLDFKCKKD